MMIFVLRHRLNPPLLFDPVGGQTMSVLLLDFIRSLEFDGLGSPGVLSFKLIYCLYEV